MNNAIKIDNLCVESKYRHILKNITLNIFLGDFIGLVGPNGGGKTTLVKAMLGLIPISKGTIQIFGIPLKQFNSWDKIGYLPQQYFRNTAFFPASVKEIVSTGLRKFNKNHKQKLINTILQKLDILDLKNRMIGELSGGQQQKVYLARALVSKPSLLILDEPSSALDPKTRSEFFSLLRAMNTIDKTTIILVTHDVGYVGKYANKLLYLDKSIVYYGDINKYCPPDKKGYTFERKDNHIIWHQHD